MHLYLEGPAGRLEARLWEPKGEPGAACAVAHPNPLQGGSLHNTVVFRIARGLQEAGALVLRFNFRGVGRSAGEHHGEGGEEEDLRAAHDELVRRFPGRPLWSAGFSFGARAAAALAPRDPRVERLLLVGLPVLAFDCSVVEEVRVPGLILQGGADDFGDLAALERLHPGLYPGLERDELPGASHFFKGLEVELQERVREAARRWLEAGPQERTR